MNHSGPWSWSATRQKKRKRSAEEVAYIKRVTAGKQAASSKQSKVRARERAAEIKRINDLPLDHGDRGSWGERYWEELRDREREEARARGPKYNPEAGRRRARAMIDATPDWADPKKMLALYDKARELTRLHGVRYHVDHIVPVQSKWVCGLNWEGNMEIIPARDNIRKGNRRWPDMPDSFLELQAQSVAHKSLSA